MVRYLDAKHLNGWAKSLYQIIDVTPAEFREKKIPGVPHKLMPTEEDFQQVLRQPVLQCRKGVRARNLAWELVEAGVAKQVFVLAGGIEAWIDAGYEVEDVE